MQRPMQHTPKTPQLQSGVLRTVLTRTGLELNILMDYKKRKSPLSKTLLSNMSAKMGLSFDHFLCDQRLCWTWFCGHVQPKDAAAGKHTWPGKVAEEIIKDNVAMWEVLLSDPLYYCSHS